MSTQSPILLPKCFTTTIEHPSFDTGLQQLLELVRQKSSTRIAIVTGPTGSGKSTLRSRFASELEVLAGPEMSADPEMVAWGGCAIKARGGSPFSWKDPYVQTLSSLRHPFAQSPTLARNRSESEKLNDALSKISPDTARRYTNDKLFRILHNTIEHRKPKAILYDEAQHFLRVGSSMTLVDQLEHIKFIADETKTLFVLFGTYELTDLIDLSSALIRRREVVHLSRYIYDPKHPRESLAEFAKVVAFFARELSAHCEIKLLKEVPYLYQGSVGCVGVLRDWLYRAYIRVQSSSDGKITMNLLKATEMVASDRNQLLDDALCGEAYLAKRMGGESVYLAKLGFPVGDVPEPPENSTDKKPSDKPFKRRPHNDPTGLGTVDPKRAAA